MSFVFRLPKVVQEVGVILAAAPEHRLNYTVLLKLLYLADRESLAEVRQPISGDTHYALPRGPVLSRVCDLIRKTSYVSEEQAEYWAKYFDVDDKEIVLKQDPGTSHLSEYEVKKLLDVFSRLDRKTFGQVLDYVDELPEVKKNKLKFSLNCRKKLIALEDIVEAIGKRDLLDEINQNKIEDEFLARILGN